ncbi:MAG: hypothetical protein FJY19_07705 [Bacteroidetes bacterium]|nr:hypothetical protein [Bacteroidota bacterium]
MIKLKKISGLSIGLLCLTLPELASAHRGYDEFVTSLCLQASRPSPKFTTDKCSTCHSSKTNTQAKTAYRAGGNTQLDYFCPGSSNTNHAPVISVPTNTQSVREGDTVSFIVSATDQDLGDNIHLSVNLELTTGATFDSASGQFSWTPTKARDQAYQVIFSAVDQAGLSTSTKVSITVFAPGESINHSPELTVPINQQNVTVGNELTFDVKASDIDGDQVEISALLPVDAQLSQTKQDSTTGEWVSVIRWTPTQLPLQNPIPITINATDNPDSSSSALSLSKTVMILVNPVEAISTIGSIRIVAAVWDRKKTQLKVNGVLKPVKKQKLPKKLTVSIYDTDSGFLLDNTIPVGSNGTWKYIKRLSLLSTPCNITAKVGGLSASIPVKKSCIDNPS